MVLFRFMVKWLRKETWQDLIFGLGQLVFMAGLLPSVLGHQKPDPITSLLTAVMLCLFLMVYVSYRLWIAFSLTTMTIGLWVVLLFQAL